MNVEAESWKELRASAGVRNVFKLVAMNPGCTSKSPGEQLKPIYAGGSSSEI